MRVQLQLRCLGNCMGVVAAFAFRRIVLFGVWRLSDCTNPPEAFVVVATKHQRQHYLIVLPASQLTRRCFFRPIVMCCAYNASSGRVGARAALHVWAGSHTGTDMGGQVNGGGALQFVANNSDKPQPHQQQQAPIHH